ncbi:PEP-CTERM sorting domain-containing protein [Methylibium sp.]|uniref:PEP-CTERM sorting domain-containing protein n=1 Tax=Methylibium sp. TaxID=2067992 RepID=UPI003D13740C
MLATRNRLALALASTGLALGLAAPAAQAALVTQWNFNSNPADGNTATGKTTPSLGSGTASLAGGVTAIFASGSASGGSSDPASSADNSGWQTTGYAAQGVGNKTRGVQFNVSTVGLQNISIGYDLRHSNTSSQYEQVQYSLDGTNYVDVASPFQGNSGDTWFNGRSVDLSSIAGVNNNASFAFRIVSAFSPTTGAYVPSAPSGSSYAGTGTWRFDMVSVSGTALPAAVPVPGALPLFGSALLAWGISMRRRRQDGKDA